MVQSPSMPAMLWTKFCSSLAPSGVCTTSGWNMMPYILRATLPKMAKGEPSELAEHLEALGQRDDAVAMAHPHLMALAGRPQALEQRAVLLDLDEGAAEFAMVGAFGDAAHLHAHGHLAVADAEHRHAGLEDDLRRARAADVDGRGRAARQDHGFRLDALERRFGRSGTARSRKRRRPRARGGRSAA